MFPPPRHLYFTLRHRPNGVFLHLAQQFLYLHAGGYCENFCGAIHLLLQLLGLPVMLLVNEVDKHIDRNDDKVNDVYDQNIIDSMVEKLGRNPRHITNNNQKDELQAHGLGGPGLDILSIRSGARTGQNR